MKLEPKAKPIKIRIMLGGEEHSTIEGVKRCFSVDELMTLIGDGRFDKWLDQIGERDKAEKIRTLRSNWDNNISDNLFKDIICILFGEQYSKDDLLSIVKSWETDHSFDMVSRNVLRFLSKINFEAAKYYYIKNKNADEPWQEIFSNIKDLDVLKELYKDEQTRTVFKGKAWGTKFSSYVNHVDTFGQIFKFVEQTSCDGVVLSSFCSSNDLIKSISHNWIGSRDLESLQAYYRNESIRPIFQKYWPILFSEFVKDNKSFEQILQWIQNENNADLEAQFIKCCANKDIEKAITLSDPWYVLARSKDYKFVKMCLEEYNVRTDYWSYDNKVDNYKPHIFNLTNPLSIQILDFLYQIKCLKTDFEWGQIRSYARTVETESKFQPYLLYRERKILEYSKKGKLKLIESYINESKEVGCVLAEKILNEITTNYYGEKQYPGFLDTQALTIEAFKEQLENARK